MASNKLSALIILFSLLAYSTFSHACGTCNPTPTPEPSPPPPSPEASPPPTPTPEPSPPPPSPEASPPPTPTPEPSPPPPSPEASPPPPPTPTPEPSPPPPSPEASPPPPQKCDALKLSVCADVLGGLVNIGPPTSSECCTYLKGFAELDASVCLCTAIKSNVIGINLNFPRTLGNILSSCEISDPPGFGCH